jgi:DNA polymerase epsilon subunit 1
MAPGRLQTNYRRQFGGGGRGRKGKSNYGSGSYRKTKVFAADSLRATEGTSLEDKFENTRIANAIDEAMGFARYESGKNKVGWLCNMHSVGLRERNGAVGFWDATLIGM